MTTLSAARTRAYMNTHLNGLPILTSTTIWAGAAVGINPTTRAVRALVGGDLFVGFAVTSVNTVPGQQRDTTVTLEEVGQKTLAVSGAVQADVGKDVYATDDDTFTLTSTGGSFVGVAKQLVSTGKLLVEISPISNLNAVRLSSDRTALVSGDGEELPISIPTASLDVIEGAVFGWWVHPTLTVDGDYTYVGFAGDTSHGVGVACIHRPSGYIKRSLIGVLDHLAEAESPVANPSDDHDVPSVTIMRDGSILAAYSAHAIETTVYIKRLGGSGNLDIAWSTELTTSANASYAQVLRVPSGLRADMLLLFYRLGDSTTGTWAVRTSVDDGRNWAAEQELIAAPYCNFSIQPGATSRVSVYAYVNPVTNGADHDPYYFILDTNTTNGGIIVPGVGSPVANTEWLGGSVTALPLARTGGLRVVDISAHPASFRMSDARRYDNNASSNSVSPTGTSAGASMLLGTEFTVGSEASTGNLYRYAYAGSGSLFTRKLVRNVGEPFFGTYYNGACFSETSVDVLYVAYNAGSKTGEHYIDKMTTTNGGTTWTAVNVVTSALRIGRPRIGQDGRLYYTEFTRYNYWNDFEGSIKWVEI